VYIVICFDESRDSDVTLGSHRADVAGLAPTTHAKTVHPVR